MQSKKKVLLKIIILGDSGVGKTALLHKYVNGGFIEEHKATIGADFLTKEIGVDQKVVTLQIWDTAGQERFQSLGTAFYRGADACVLVYDITNPKSLENLNQWRNNFLEQCNPDDPQGFPFLVIGNKHDLSGERDVPTSDGERFARTHAMKFYETSALTGKNVDAAMEDLSAEASEMESAPYFSPDVVTKIDSFNQGKDIQPPQPGCACELI